MSVDKIMEVLFGVMVIASVALTKVVHPDFFWLTLFVGANLVQQAVTGFCPVAFGLRKAGMQTERQLGEGRT